jgi:NADH-quinone oxidoreductase subunit C
MYDPASAVKGLVAVRAAMPENPAVVALGELAVDAKFDRDELTLEVLPENVTAAGEALKAAGYNFLEDLTAVDWYPSEPRFQMTYTILSHSLKKRIRLIARVHGDSPAINTMTTVWPSANFYEREVFDLFGVRFGGHPNMTRIMMPVDWQGHPLRKDYPVEGYR